MLSLRNGRHKLRPIWCLTDRHVKMIRSSGAIAGQNRSVRWHYYPSFKASLFRYQWGSGLVMRQTIRNFEQVIRMILISIAVGLVRRIDRDICGVNWQTDGWEAGLSQADPTPFPSVHILSNLCSYNNNPLSRLPLLLPSFHPLIPHFTHPAVNCRSSYFFNTSSTVRLTLQYSHHILGAHFICSRHRRSYDCRTSGTLRLHRITYDLALPKLNEP